MNNDLYKFVSNSGCSSVDPKVMVDLIAAIIKLIIDCTHVSKSRANNPSLIDRILLKRIIRKNIDEKYRKDVYNILLEYGKTLDDKKISEVLHERI